MSEFELEICWCNQSNQISKTAVRFGISDTANAQTLFSVASYKTQEVAERLDLEGRAESIDSVMLWRVKE